MIFYCFIVAAFLLFSNEVYVQIALCRCSFCMLFCTVFVGFCTLWIRPANVLYRIFLFSFAFLLPSAIIKQLKEKLNIIINVFIFICDLFVYYSFFFNFTICTFSLDAVSRGYYWWLTVQYPKDLEKVILDTFFPSVFVK